VGGQTYRSVRIGAAIGYRIIGEILHLKVKPRGRGIVELEDPVLRGYLANLSPRRFRREFERRLPEKIKGSHFLDCFAGITDPSITVEPRREYPVRAPTAHPVSENLRATTFAALIESYRSAPDREILKAMGELMLSSHESYVRCGLGDPATDLLVDLAMAEGPARGIYGAKSSGGGSGGTVVVLLERRGRRALARIASAYRKKTGRPAPLVRGTSAGALKLGTVSYSSGKR
jgi:L-arabinokinase